MSMLVFILVTWNNILPLLQLLMTALHAKPLHDVESADSVAQSHQSNCFHYMCIGINGGMDSVVNRNVADLLHEIDSTEITLQRLCFEIAFLLKQWHELLSNCLYLSYFTHFLR